MKIKIKDEKKLKEELQKADEIINEILLIDLSEKELTGESIELFEKVSRKIRELKWINFEGLQIELIDSAGTEPIIKKIIL